MNKSKTSLFLMELIISILFFSIASAVCIQLFVKSHLISSDTINTNHSVMWAENMAELFLASDGDLSILADALEKEENLADPDYDDLSQSITLYFDADWKIISAEANPSYILILQKDPSVSAYASAAIDVSAIDSSSALYHLDVQKYIQKGSGL